MNKSLKKAIALISILALVIVMCVIIAYLSGDPITEAITTGLAIDSFMLTGAGMYWIIDWAQK